MAAQETGLSGLALRYAKALFVLAEEKGALDQTARELAGLAKLIESSADLRTLLRSPVISRIDQARALNAVLEKLGSSPLILNLSGVMAQHRRLFALERVIRLFGELLAQHRGEIAAEVISATPLKTEHVAAVRDALKRVVGRDVALDQRVDPGLIGGLVVKVGSRMIDNSLRTKLQKLELALKGA